MKQKTKRIYLMGFMGAGKTSVGKRLAKKLGWAFVDSDAEIERSEKKRIPKIFDQVGEKGFRKIESKVIQKLSRKSQIVISLGGGAPTQSENMSLIRKTGSSVYLKAFATTVVRRTRGSSRPLLAVAKSDTSRLGLVRKMSREREKFYKRADFHIRTDTRSPDQIAGQVHQWATKRGLT